GGVRFTLEFAPDLDRELFEEDKDKAVDVLRTRLSPDGVLDVNVRREGADRIVVDIPLDNTELSEDELASKVKEWETAITRAAQLTFHMAHPNYSDFIGETDPDEVIVPGGSFLPYRIGEKDDPSAERRYMLVRQKAEIEGDQVKRAYAGNELNKWKIYLSLQNEGADRFYELSKIHNTSNGTGQQLPFAIVLDKEIISAPVFNEPIAGGSAVISGDFTEAEARGLATAMQNPLQAPMEVVFKEYFPPTLAKAAIQQGVRSTLIGIALTILFMIIFYRLAGVIALFGLTVNMILLFGVLAVFGADFTLTGIAGVILTLGMSIDANVLIYERLREERAAGKSLRASIQTAYEKAFSAIFDANLTTLITALILFWVSVGAIKGFAVTLSIGIIVSLFSSLLVTRVFFTWGNDTGLIKDLNFMSVLSNRVIDFLGKAKVTRIISVALVIIGIAVVLVKGGSSLGIDFTGGDQFRFAADSSVKTEIIEAELDKLNLKKAYNIERLKPLGSSEEYVSVRVGPGEGTVAQDAIKAVGIDVGKTEVTEISGVVAGEMKEKSILALGLGLLAILLYVTVRFEFSFAIGAIIAVLHDLVIAAGVVILLDVEINLVMVGAFLTIAGYSINDTIVVFDRIRENLRTKRGDIKDVMNLAINTTLSRTVLTSVTTLLTLLALFLAGGAALRDFSLSVIIGILIGTYSSIFVASPIVYWWSQMRGNDLRHEVLEAEADKLLAEESI
ncbi:MAG: SecD/SecF fusion protein, partial [Verrucomicrobiales bacterium]